MQLRWVSVPVVVALTLLGIWIFGGVVTNDFVTSMALVTFWFAALALAALVVARRSRSLRWPVLVSFVATSAIAGGALAYPTFHDRVVNEEVAVAGGGNVLLNRGRFVSAAHETSGRVEVVAMRGGSRTLTFTNLDTDAGPDLRVYLTAESIGSSDDAGVHVDLGGLKGNKGTQQYGIPRGVDLGRYSNVVIWCRAFRSRSARRRSSRLEESLSNFLGPSWPALSRALFHRSASNDKKGGRMRRPRQTPALVSGADTRAAAPDA